MTARSKKRRMKNSRIKRERNKLKELSRLQKTVGVKNLMDICRDVVDEKTVEELKQVCIAHRYDLDVA